MGLQEGFFSVSLSKSKMSRLNKMSRFWILGLKERFFFVSLSKGKMSRFWILGLLS